jgi:hypothetical protein
MPSVCDETPHAYDAVSSFILDKITTIGIVLRPDPPPAMSTDVEELGEFRRQASEALNELLGLLKPYTITAQAFSCMKHANRIDEICQRAGVIRGYRAVGGIAVDPYSYPMVYWDMREVQIKLAISNRSAAGAIVHPDQMQQLAVSLRSAVDEFSADAYHQPYSLWQVLRYKATKLLSAE